MAALLLAVLTGCATTDRGSVEKNLRGGPTASWRQQGVREHYLVGCPDELELEVPNHPELAKRHVIGPDGRLDLGDYGRLRVDGQPLTEVARLLAAETGSEPEQVKVRVTDYRSQVLLLFGEVIGWQRAVPYQGQETVLDLLQRVGGITPGAEPGDVYVVRPHLGGGQRPEVFHVDLRAIVMRHDEQTNLRVLPFDQVYVGTTGQAQVEKLLAPWMRRLYQAVWDTRPRPAAPPPAAEPGWVHGPRVGTAEEEAAGE